MSRYIDEITFIKEIDKIDPKRLSIKTIGEALVRTPTADVVEVRRGERLKQKTDPGAMKIIHEMGLGKGMSVKSIYWTCSICANWGTPTHKYCCSCGAKMDGARREK